MSWKWLLLGLPVVGGLSLYNIQIASAAGFVLLLMLFVAAVFGSTTR